VKVVLPHVLLVAATALYTVIGAAIFEQIERPHEFRVKTENAKSVRDMQVVRLTGNLDVEVTTLQKISVQNVGLTNSSLFLFYLVTLRNTFPSPKMSVNQNNYLVKKL
jgi:hypothetical protein